VSPDKVLALLHIGFPDGTEQVVPITQPQFDIGRSAGNGLQLPDQLVSRHHARLLVEDDRHTLIDMNSSNGTLVGNSRLEPNQPHVLSPGETFRIGPYALRLDAAPAPSSPETPAEAAAEIGVEDVAAPPAEPEAIAADIPEEPSPPAEPQIRIGVAEAPPRPPPVKPPPENGRPSYDEAFGLQLDRSRYLQYLPPIYHEHPFLGRFLLAFEGVMAPIEQMVDNLDLFLDPRTVPAFFLNQLAAWLDMTLDEKWPVEKRRAVVAEAGELYRRRGTRWSLSRFLEIYTGVEPRIEEPEDKPHHFRVVLRVPRGNGVDRGTVERIIQANKPAHTTYALEIRQDRKR